LPTLESLELYRKHLNEIKVAAERICLDVFAKKIVPHITR